MAYTHSAQYLESEVYSADPLKLVNMLYRAAIESVGAAREHLAAGRIRERSQKVTKAWKIVQELRESLDAERGGELSARLSELYVYMQNRLIEANAQQKDAPLAEVEQILSTLHEGWQAASTAAGAAYLSAEEYQPVSCTY